MGSGSSKPKKPKTAEEVLQIIEDYPEIVQQYYAKHEDEIEEYIVENFWEEDVARWLQKIRNRSPKENLQVRKIDFLKKRNTSVHNTSLYENKTLVIRRAAEFDIDVYFGNRAFVRERDDISIIFRLGSNPTEANKTKIVCLATGVPGKKEKWHCIVTGEDSKAKRVTLKVHVPANAVIGRYSVSLDIVSGTKEGRVHSTHKGSSVIVLFNPFSEDDTVYMEDAEWQKEYVLNDEGFICIGVYNPRFPVLKKKWDFAQFDEGILDAVLLMIQNDKRIKTQYLKALRKCNSPAFVSRVLSAMINSADDKGVLEGNWSKNFEGGMHPFSWSSSAAIISQWSKENMMAVKYGQCWVYSGVLTTALRAIGIPARSVTNFSSAHDTDMNQTIDTYMNSETFDRLDETSDYVWNFHVWNEGYFARPDLPEGYGGWQVVDATPQEESAILDPTGMTSSALAQCGPAPVKAVKEGNVNIGSDTGFVFSEVNADEVYWYVDGEGKLARPPKVKKAAVGLYIGTKAVGKYETENILSQYKYPEGSHEERAAFNKAYGLGTKKHGDFDFELVPDAFEVTINDVENAVFGKDLATTVSVKNVSGKIQHAKITIKAITMKYIGTGHVTLEKMTKSFELGDGKAMSFAFEIPKDAYIGHLVDNSSVRIKAIVESKPDGNTSVEVHDIGLDLPDCIEVKAPKEMPWGEVHEVEATITNNFPMPITKGIFWIEGRGVDLSTSTTDVGKPIQPGETFTVKAKVSAKAWWRRINVSAVFESANIPTLREMVQIRIKS